MPRWERMRVLAQVPARALALEPVREQVRALELEPTRALELEPVRARVPVQPQASP